MKWWPNRNVRHGVGRKCQVVVDIQRTRLSFSRQEVKVYRLEWLVVEALLVPLSCL